MIELTSYHLAWLKSIAKDGPTACCLDGMARSLMRKGLLRRLVDGRHEATDLGRQVALAAKGEQSFVTATA